MIEKGVIVRKKYFIIGVDTGGTFTDAIAISEDGSISEGKSSSTPPNFEKGVLNALHVLAGNLGMTVEQLLGATVIFTYGTTVASNILTMRRGAKTGLITTKGHEDALYIMRAKGRTTGLTEEEVKFMARTWKPEPIIPKNLVRGVSERVDSKGRIVCPLNEDELRSALSSLAKDSVESIAIGYLWSFVNHEHEEKTKKVVSEMYPHLFVSSSHEVAPSVGEYERILSTVIDAYLGPETRGHIDLLGKLLTEKGLKSPLLVMQCHGGLVYPGEARAVATIESGPVAGIIGTEFVANLLGYKDVIATDVGGTTFKIGLLEDGTWSYTKEPRFERFDLAIPMVEVVSIGAGGGSIAAVDLATKLITVGPQSAGAIPGPACYGIGGTEPTVTDAFVVLGYINPDYFLGGQMKLHKDKAIAAVNKIASALGMSAVEAAAGILDIANAHMADLIRSYTVGRGYDPRRFSIFAYGGAGPAHGAMYGAELGVKEVVMLPTSSVYSAFGMATSNISHTYAQPYFAQMPVDPDKLSKNFQLLRKRASEDLQRDGVTEETMTFLPSVAMRYGRQVHVVSTPISDKISYTSEDMTAFCAEFERRYELLFGKGSGSRSAGILVESLFLKAIGKKPWDVTIAKVAPAKEGLKVQDLSRALKGKRDSFFRKYNGFVSTNTYDWVKLQPGNIIEGPAIIEAKDTTGIIPPDQVGYVDEYLNIVVRTK
jgi:N-methylhydantoinase A